MTEVLLLIDGVAYAYEKIELFRRAAKLRFRIGVRIGRKRRVFQLVARKGVGFAGATLFEAEGTPQVLHFPNRAIAEYEIKEETD